MPRHEYSPGPSVRDRQRLDQASFAAAPNHDGGGAGDLRLPRPASSSRLSLPPVRPTRAGATTTSWAAGGVLGRLVLIVLVVAGVAVPFGGAASFSWSRIATDSTTATAEIQGATYLQPLVRLISATADQQSLDVGGTPGNGAALTAAVHDVDQVDASLGRALGVHDRWIDVRQRLNAVLAAPPAAAAAFEQFTGLTDLEMALAAEIGDTSTLILDPQLDTYYLMDVALLRMPAILTDAGRLDDRARRPGPYQAEVAALTDRVRQQFAELDTSMRKSFAATQANVLTPGLVSALDQFDDAVTALVPPSAGYAGVLDRAGLLQRERERVRDTGLVLEDAALHRLQQLLGTRQDTTDSRRLLLLVTASAGMLVAVVAGFLLLRRRPAVATDPAPGPVSGAGTSPRRTSPGPVDDPRLVAGALTNGAGLGLRGRP
jgi:hypothetical protein